MDGEDPFSDSESSDDVLARFATLRQSGTIVHSERLGGWVIAHHADVRALLLDRRLTAARTSSYAAALNDEARALRVEALLTVRQHMPMFAEGEAHRLGRMPFRGAGKSSAPTADALAAAAGEFLRSFQAGDVVDAVQQFAAPYALRALTLFLGVDAKEGRRLDTWAAVMHAALSPSRSLDQVEAADAAVREMAEWLDDVDATDGPIEQVQRLLRENRIERDVGVAFVVSAVSAGATTIQDALGNALARIAEDDSVRRAMLPMSSREDAIVDEFLRFEGPILVTRRQVASPLSVRGVGIEAGQRVVLGILSANRDPDVFVDAEQFMPGRADRSRAIPFGFGAHRCAAAEFGRAAFSMGLRAFTDRFPCFAVAGEPEWRAGATMRGRKRVLLRIA